ncbi:Metallo-dependent phosphatase-like protein [Mycena floridula]|nr:Metallo-dependent phosphatase-like protein [Mycena floridula]
MTRLGTFFKSLVLVTIIVAVAIIRFDPQHEVLPALKVFKLNWQFPFTLPSDDFSEDLPPPFTRHIVSVGDLHGDYPNAQKVLQFSGVVDEFGNWTGNVDIFVQTGDIIDRGDDTIKLFMWMDKLREQAAATGGLVISHLGNHEWMNAIGDWRYVYPSEIKTFGTVAARQKMLSTGRIGRSWAKNYTTASRLPLHPSMGPLNTPYPPKSMKDSLGPLSHSALAYVHGGLSPSYSGLSPFPSRINELSDSLLHKLQNRKQPPPHPPNPPVHLPNPTAAEAELYSANGPLWYRGWAYDPDEVVCEKADEVLAKIGARRLIQGHTPDFSNIVSRCDGKIIIIDTGISRAYGGVLSALSIHYTLKPLAGFGSGKDQKWQEREVVSALYDDREDIITVDEREIVGDFAT